MLTPLRKALKWVGILLLVLFVGFLGSRVWFAQSGAPLEPWHTFVPEEMTVAELDEADWAAYLAREDKLFSDVTREVVQKLPEDERIPSNRYFSGSIVYPPSLTHDWNRSYEMVPVGEPAGAVVLLHGLTDSPYSLRHTAQRYLAAGFVVVAPRLPGHGTVPAGLTEVEWEDWLAATRLAMREAAARAPGKPLEIVGFSNGGALALKYALDALSDDKLARPSRLVLISPMIGITRFARFAGLAALPAWLPAFDKAAWLGIVPEFNPFKYNSFPVNGAVQSHRLTRALQASITAQARAGKLAELPPALTFQSVMDFTVSTRAIIDAFYSQLPANGSELVLFDINRNTKLGPLLRATSYSALMRLLPPLPRNFRTVIITNEDSGSDQVVERSIAAGSSEEVVRPLGLSYPLDVYSLSHVALPFPSSDSLYGSAPDPKENFGLQLGAMAVRGERGALIVSLDALVRMSSNPFFPYMIDRIAPPVSTAQAGTPENAASASSAP
ncbi:2-succinyl-6-hydroxy-2,4-cyclohexadiene-1-carboxylate synthase [Starkeya nomas]|uniref:2-succinyl-6-hydroxy-2,4-cyclohexadiene-1-carboxy late synthase n=1 Tax=Starkeya nomas TaxID=2666134 RepID=A0A5S9P3M8_9HYPH|nr:alpha/beta hydrolase [Starkeya nomas]CAA0097716.1 2-succinyl-6-hydroxy-2,4-cyclohexadiene-1-carboxylate synthase [Starkeya nomas]